MNRLGNLSEEMSGTILEAVAHFAMSVEDYRRTKKGNFKHPLPDLILLVILCYLDGQIYYKDCIAFAERNLGRLQSTYGILKNGVPSVSTLCRMFQCVEHEMMSDMLQGFANRFADQFNDQEIRVISVDGKATRGTINENGRNPDIISAYDVGAGITLATELCEKKSNELKAAPKLLNKIPLEGNVLTMDAMFCHREITDPIVSAGGYFVIELKANQKDLFYNSADRLKTAKSYSVTVEDFQLDHGRIERRTCRVYHPEDLDVDPEKWSCVLRIIEVNVMSTDKKNRKETSDRRLYISNLDTDAATFGNIIRQHWSIESMHWQLDRNFKQDQIKRKREAGARNLDTLQRIALSIIHIWKKLRRKKSDKAKGVTEILRMLRGNLTAIFRFLMQK